MAMACARISGGGSAAHLSQIARLRACALASPIWPATSRTWLPWRLQSQVDAPAMERDQQRQHEQKRRQREQERGEEKVAGQERGERLPRPGLEPREIGRASCRERG